MLGRKLPLRSVGMRRSMSPGCVVNRRGRDPVRSVTRVSVFVTGGADPLGRVDLDQPCSTIVTTSRIRSTPSPGTERVQQLGPSVGTWRDGPTAWRTPTSSRGSATQSRRSFVVRPPGFEPGTNGLRVHCSAVELEALVRPGSVRAAWRRTPPVRMG